MSLSSTADGLQSPFNVNKIGYQSPTVPYDKIGYLIDLNPERLGVLAENGGENDKNYRQFESGVFNFVLTLLLILLKS